MQRQKRQHIAAQWPPTFNTSVNSQYQIRNLNPKDCACSVETASTQPQQTASSEQPLCIGDKRLEAYVEMQATKIVEKYIEAWQERLLQLENRIQRLESANQEETKKSSIIPLQGGIATTAPSR